MIHQGRKLVVIETLPPGDMRYETTGDWWRDADGLMHIQVSDNMPVQEQLLCALHEWVEAMLCEAHGVRQTDVDAFDMAFTGGGEPGDDPRAPYRAEHRQAALVEFQVAHAMGIEGYGRVDWGSE